MLWAAFGCPAGGDDIDMMGTPAGCLFPHSETQYTARPPERSNIAAVLKLASFDTIQAQRDAISFRSPELIRRNGLDWI